MAANDLFTINISIAGRVFPVKVTEEEKTVVEGIVLEINEKINNFQKMYTGRDKLDYVIMTLLTYIYDLKSTPQTETSDETGPKVQLILDLLSDF